MRPKNDGLDSAISNESLFDMSNDDRPMLMSELQSNAAPVYSTKKASRTEAANVEPDQENNSAVWTPPKNPDPGAISKEATDDAQQGRYEIALAKRVWYHENALSIQPSLVGVRLSFALSKWLQLGEVYPPALAKMKEMRDASEQRIRDPQAVRVRFEDFQEFASFNDTLREPERTFEIFRWLDQFDPEDARRMFRLARKSLIKAEAYQLYGKYIDADRDIDQIRNSYQLLLKSAANGKHSDMMLKHAEKTLVNDASTLVAILVKLNQPEEAKAAAEKAMQLVSNQQDLLSKINKQLELALDGKLP